MKVARFGPSTRTLAVWIDESEIGREPYCWCGAVVDLELGEIEICRTMKAPTTDEWRAIVAECKANGIKRILMTRVLHGQKKKHWVEVK